MHSVVLTYNFLNTMKTNIFFTVILFLVFSFCGESVKAYDFSYTYQGKKLYYKIIASDSVKTVEVSHYTLLADHDNNNNYISGDVIIPSEVIFNDTTYTVIAIGYRAFWNCTELTSVEIPSTITRISSYAFCDCTNLTTIDLPTSVTELRFGVFWGSGLVSISLPSSLTTTGNHTFGDCKNLAEVEIPSSITTIDTSCFYGCTSLTSIVIPSSVTTIKQSAFLGTALKSIDIPSSVTTIESAAFQNCKSLSSINMTSSVTTIEWSAFSLCDNLEIVNLPSSLTSISNSLFWGCTNLKKIDIPASVTLIDQMAFYQCSSLDTMICRGTTPPTVVDMSGTTLAGNVLLVPCEAINSYKDSTWFYNNFLDNIHSFDTIVKVINAAIFKDGTYSYDGIILSNIGTYIYNFITANGCDSTVILNLNSIAAITNEVTQTTTHLTAKFATNSSIVKRGVMINNAVAATTTNNNLVTTITDLIPNTTYSCKPFVVLTNNDTLFGNDQPFTTLEVSFSGYATDITTSSAELVATFVADEWITERGITFDKQVLVQTDKDTLVTIVNDLMPNTTHAFQPFVVASGDTIWGIEILFTTLVDSSSIKDVVSTTNNTPTINLYPNPAVDKVYISSNNTDLSKAHIYIYDIQGNMVRSLPLTTNTNSLSLDISSLSLGTYTIILTTSQTQLSQKLIKQ